MSMPQSSWPNGRQNFMQTIPVTKIVLGLMLVSFMAAIVQNTLSQLLLYVPFIIPNGVTGLFTDPFVFAGAGDIINLLISGLMLWMFGGSLERSWGPRMYIAFLALASAVSALVWTAGAWLFQGVSGIIAGPWLLISAIIVAWAWLNPNETIMFWFVLPLRAKWIGWLDIVLLFFIFPAMQGVHGALALALGFFALGGVAVAYAFARYHRDWAWILRPHTREKANRRVLRHPSSTFFGALTRPWREWQRRRRIAYLEKTIRFEEEDQKK